MNTLGFRVDQRHGQTLSPRLQRAVRLLQMSSLDFADQIHEAMGNNPFLEDDDNEADFDGPAVGHETVHVGDSLPPDPGATEPLPGSAETLEGGPDDRDLWQTELGSASRRNDDGALSAVDLAVAETSLTSHLHGQLNLLPLPPRDLVLAKVIVESLDDDGYLREQLDALCDIPGLAPPATRHEMQTALRRVQSLEPAGVGARSVAECIALQLPTIPCPEMRLLASAVINEHIETLASRDVAALAHKLNCPLPRMQTVCERIRRLDPRPGWRFSASTVRYVVPDVLARKHRGEWTVQLNPAVVPKVRLNQVYADLFERHRATHNAELAGHLQDARWTLRNVEQRFSTILGVAEAIVKRQHHFLDFGAMAMKPLGLREIADELGLHESTVSRVTNNKYISTPSGVYELKYFFSRVMLTAAGKACSGTAIRGVIKEMIEGEAPHRSLSDADITRLLAQQGLLVARRTVTKYRQLLRIESVDRRRRQAI